MNVIKERYEEEMKRKAFNDILSHKYFIKGNCFKCGKEYARCSDQRKSNKDLYCSEDCYNDSKEDRKRRNKEKHHYEVYKDNKFYYIVVDSVFHTKRDFKGKSWMKPSEQDRERKEDVLKRISDWKHLIISEQAIIPKEAIKIIDMVSAYLYEDNFTFNQWKDLKEIEVIKDAKC